MSTKVKSRSHPGVRAGEAQGGERTADPRREAMLSAAFDAFLEHGVSGTTTEEIARRARVSKREIYRLFGNKEVLFAELVRARGTSMRRGLALAPPESRATALEALERFGCEFLTLLTDRSTVAVYRLAIAEAGRAPELGRQLDLQGRGTVRESLQRWLTLARDKGVLPVTDPDRAAGTFLVLLSGDVTVRQLLGAVGPLDAGEISSRSAAASAAFQRLWLGQQP
jgi:TetR/AcrR family transcriptional regulator, mexJK operon transcriptional repressor